MRLQAVEGRTMLRSTVASPCVVLHTPLVCALGFDSNVGTAITGDTDGLVRLWDVHKAVRGGDQAAARLGAVRMHNKGPS